MATRGGSRPGAGRPKTRNVNETAVRAAEKKIRDRLPQIIDNLLILADGVTVQEFDEKLGGNIVYTKPPCRQTNEYLVNRILGKPTEKVESENSGGMTVRVVYGTDGNTAPISPGADRDLEEPEAI
jgi:hypothetical protein